MKREDLIYFMEFATAFVDPLNKCSEAGDYSGREIVSRKIKCLEIVEKLKAGEKVEE